METIKSSRNGDKITYFRFSYAWLSNFHECEIVINNVGFYSVEQAYHYFMCDSDDWKLFCLQTKDAAIIKTKSKTIVKRENWDKIKVKIMYELLKRKFIYNSDLMQKLLETNPKEIIEGNYWAEDFWGFDLEKQKGHNILGKLLMKIRQEIIDRTIDIECKLNFLK